MATNSLGGFNFITFYGTPAPASPPQLVGEQSRLVQRPGVDGTGVIQLGAKGRPFQMLSVVDATSILAGHQLQALYKATQNDALYTIVCNDINYATAFDHQYVVLEVEPIEVKRITASVGGLSIPSVARVVALWTLLPVYVPPEP